MKTFLPFIIIGICIGMYFMYISPTWAEIGTLTARKAQYTNVLDKVKELTAERDAAITAYNNIPADDIARLSKIVPSKFDPVLFVNDVNNLALKYGLNMKEFNTNLANTSSRDVVSEDTRPYKTITVSLKVTGPYSQFIKFLKDVESSLHLMDVVNLSVTANVGTGKNPVDSNPEYSLEIHTYSLE